MFNTKYLIRLDDACSFMDIKKWQRMEDILDRYSVKPLVGIIPANADPKTMIESENPMFWDKLRLWEKKGWQVALHGYDHVCTSDGGLRGLNPFWKRSEYAGLPLEKQKEKIRKGMEILGKQGFKPKYFFAPSHTFDENTLQALKEETDIRIISDTIAFYPYQKGEFVFIPQISGHCVKMPVPGIYTFCFHPNTMKEEEFNKLELFLESYKNQFIGFNDIDIANIKDMGIMSKVLRSFFFAYRKIRGLQ